MAPCNMAPGIPPPETPLSNQTAGSGPVVPGEAQCIVAPCNMAPGVPQTPSPALSNQTAVPPGTPPLTPEQLYESCLQGIGGGIPGNCKPPTSSPALSNQTLPTCWQSNSCSTNSNSKNMSTATNRC